MTTEQVVKYNVTDAAIATMEKEFLPLTIDGVDDKVGFAAVHDARMVVRGKRVEIEKTRKELKADALEYGRAVDAEAKRITAGLQPIEDHLEQQEDSVKEAKAELKAKADAEKQAKFQQRVDLLQELGAEINIYEIQAMTDEVFVSHLERARTEHEAEQERKAKEAAERKAREAEEAKAKAEQERVAEEERAEQHRKLDEERAALAKTQEEEEAKLAAQRAEQERVAAEQEEKAATIRAEQQKVEAQRAKFDEEKRLEVARKEAAEQAKFEAEAKAKRDAEEKAAAKRRAAEEEEEAKRKAAEEAARLEELKPDRDKLVAYGEALLAVDRPALKSDEAQTLLREIDDKLTVISDQIAEW